MFDFSNIKEGIFKKSKKKISVGVDIGSKSIKVVELERKNDKLYLKNYAIANSKKELVKAGAIGVISGMTGQILEKVLDESGIDEDVLNVSVPSFASLVTTIEVPNLPSGEIDQVIQAEAPKYIPVKLEDVVYDWQIIEEGAKDFGQKENSDTSTDLKRKKDLSKKELPMVKVLVVAIMKEISSHYEKVFVDSGFEIESLEIDSFSLSRALVGNAKGVYMILDMGRKVTNILIVSNKNILINRSIDIAGDKITSTLAQGLAIDESRAEKIKIERGIYANCQVEGDLGVLTPTITVLLNEIKRTIELFRKVFKGKEIDKIILSGGAAKMVGFQDFIEKEMEIETINGDPLSGIEFPPEIKEVLIKSSPLLSVSVGLAMLGFED